MVVADLKVTKPSSLTRSDRQAAELHCTGAAYIHNRATLKSICDAENGEGILKLGPVQTPPPPTLLQFCMKLQVKIHILTWHISTDIQAHSIILTGIRNLVTSSVCVFKCSNKQTL